jgi:hypothetical protein
MYVKIENGSVSQYPYSYYQLISDNPKTSFPDVMPDDQLDSWGVFPVTPTTAPTPAPGQIVEELTPAEIGGVWTQQWIARAATQDETDQKASDVRTQRNELLYQCDWTQLADSSVDKTAWANYRQQLRDVPQQAGFPWEVVWPTPPQ